MQPFRAFGAFREYRAFTGKSTLLELIRIYLVALSRAILDISILFDLLQYFEALQFFRGVSGVSCLFYVSPSRPSVFSTTSVQKGN